ncbi:hypothetical protein D3C75_1207940 [compost metagenome]
MLFGRQFRKSLLTLISADDILYISVDDITLIDVTINDVTLADIFSAGGFTGQEL